MIEWLNRNQGFVTAALTFIYVLTTLALAYFALRSQRLAERHLKLTLELEHRRTRPYVSCDIITRNGLVFSTLTNSGQTAALDVKVDIQPDLIREVGGRPRESGLTKHQLGSLAPGRRLEDFLDAGPGFFARFKDPVFRGQLRYKDQTGSRYDESVIVDLTVHHDLLFTPDHDIGKELKALTEAVKRLQPIGR